MSPIIWNTSPVLLEMGPLQIRWYGLCFAAAFLCGVFLMHRMYAKENLRPESVDNLFFFVIAGTLIGARLGHCLFYEPAYYLSHPLEILKVWKGGLASHGGVIGIVIGVAIHARGDHGLSFIQILDRLCIPSALGAAFIRAGNLFNSEILGRPTDGSWGVIFKRVDMIPRHPVQLYESVSYLLFFLLLITMYRKENYNPPPGLLFGTMLVTIFGGRILFEFFKIRQASFANDWFLSVGQLLSIPFVAAGIGLIAMAIRHRQSNAGSRWSSTD